jgi:hypothetical protein
LKQVPDMRILNTVLIRRILLLGAWLATAHQAAGAQASAPDSVLQVGTRVRVFESSPSTRKTVGQLAALDRDTLTLYAKDSRVRAVPLERIDSVQVSRSRRHLPAAFLGVFAGAAVGAALLGGTGMLLDTFGTPSDIPAVAFGLYYGVLIGAPVGAVVLGVRGFEAWATVWPERAPSGPTPAGSMTFSLSIRIP